MSKTEGKLSDRVFGQQCDCDHISMFFFDQSGAVTWIPWRMWLGVMGVVWFSTFRSHLAYIIETFDDNLMTMQPVDRVKRYLAHQMWCISHTSHIRLMSRNPRFRFDKKMLIL